MKTNLFWNPTFIKSFIPDNVRIFSMTPPCVISGGGLSIKGCRIDLIWPKLCVFNYFLNLFKLFDCSSLDYNPLWHIDEVKETDQILFVNKCSERTRESSISLIESNNLLGQFEHISTYVCLSVYLPLCLSACLSVSLSACLCICLSVSQFVCLSVCVNICKDAPKNSSYFTNASASFIENCAIEFQFSWASSPKIKYFPLGGVR